MATKIPPEERLMNLTVALMGTEIGLTRAQIFSSVSGYVEQVTSGSGEPALERMFERDKRHLVGLGMRIEVIGASENDKDLRGARYRIPREDNELPEDLEFTPSELAVLSLAADAWGEATMSQEARAGLRKIRALGLDVDEPILGLTPRLTARDSSFEPLRDAIERGADVRFEYLRPGSQRVRTRRVRPLALVQFEGRWHLHGHDEGVGERRTFLLSRIVSEITPTGTRFDPSDQKGAADATLRRLRELAAVQRARIEVTPGSEAALRLGRRSVSDPSAQGIEVPYVDAYVFADEVASYGPEARVVAPDDLRDLVIARLRATRVLHERPADLARAERAEPVATPRRAPRRDFSERVRTYLTLVPWLLERGEVPLADVAREFDVRPDELRQLLSTLTVIGAPAGGLYTGDMFDIDWEALEERDAVRLTRTVGIERVQRMTTREVAALIVGLELVETMTGEGEAQLLTSLRAKLARGSGEPAGDAVAVDTVADPLQRDLARAVRERRAVRFVYRRPDGEATRRQVDPSRLILADGAWYLQGWCHLREATRTFLFDRMSDLVVTAEPAEHSGDMLPALFEPGADDLLATLRFPTRMRPLLAEFLEHAELSEDGADTFARLPVADVGTLRRVAARGGGDVEVVAPSEARAAAKDWADAGEKLHASAVH